MPQPHASEARALRLVESEPGVLTHPTADQRLAVEQWLLATTQQQKAARMEWQETGVALLPLGGLFSAVRIPVRLILALTAGAEDLADLDAFLGEVLDGPVICDPQHGPRYYALVPASTPTTWRRMVDDVRADDVDVLGRGTFLGVPRVDAIDGDRHPLASYWSVPMSAPGMLCGPLTVARLIAAGRHQLVGELEA